jgi:hypothetical protein
MQIASGVKSVFQAQSEIWPSVDGLVQSHAAYWPRVTSVLSME